MDPNQVSPRIRDDPKFLKFQQEFYAGVPSGTTVNKNEVLMAFLNQAKAVAPASNDSEITTLQKLQTKEWANLNLPCGVKTRLRSASDLLRDNQAPIIQRMTCCGQIVFEPLEYFDELFNSFSQTFIRFPDTRPEFDEAIKTLISFKYTTYEKLSKLRPVDWNSLRLPTMFLKKLLSLLSTWREGPKCRGVRGGDALDDNLLGILVAIDNLDDKQVQKKQRELGFEDALQDCPKSSIFSRDLTCFDPNQNTRGGTPPVTKKKTKTPKSQKKETTTPDSKAPKKTGKEVSVEFGFTASDLKQMAKEIAAIPDWDPTCEAHGKYMDGLTILYGPMIKEDATKGLTALKKELETMVTLLGEKTPNNMTTLIMTQMLCHNPTANTIYYKFTEFSLIVSNIENRSSLLISPEDLDSVKVPKSAKATETTKTKKPKTRDLSSEKMGDEAKLNFFRNDWDLGLTHHNFHNKQSMWKHYFDRFGEIFLFSHSELLKRYMTERKILALPDLGYLDPTHLDFDWGDGDTDGPKIEPYVNSPVFHEHGMWLNSQKLQSSGENPYGWTTVGKREDDSLRLPRHTKQITWDSGDTVQKLVQDDNDKRNSIKTAWAIVKKAIVDKKFVYVGSLEPTIDSAMENPHWEFKIENENDLGFMIDSGLATFVLWKTDDATVHEHYTNPKKQKTVKKLFSVIYGLINDTDTSRKVGANLHSWCHDVVRSMRMTYNNLRDPYFWRWHWVIEQIYKQGKALDTNPENALEYAPLIADSFVKIEAKGIQLGPHDRVTVDILNGQFNLGKLPTATENNIKFDADTTQTMQTFTVTHPNFLKPFEWGKQLYVPFGYYLKVERKAAGTKMIPFIVRTFMCKTSEKDNFDYWFLLDVFPSAIPKDKPDVVIARSVLETTMIRRDTLADKYNADAYQIDSCTCGVPWNLLIPSGSSAGEDFKLAVFLTLGSDIPDGTFDGTENNAGAFSFCPSKWSEYPDKKRMGYPFCRPFPDDGGPKTITEILEGAKYSFCAYKNIKIKRMRVKNFDGHTTTEISDLVSHSWSTNKQNVIEMGSTSLGSDSISSTLADGASALPGVAAAHARYKDGQVPPDFTAKYQGLLDGLKNLWDKMHIFPTQNNEDDLLKDYSHDLDVSKEIKNDNNVRLSSTNAALSGHLVNKHLSGALPNIEKMFYKITGSGTKSKLKGKTVYPLLIPSSLCLHGQFITLYARAMLHKYGLSGGEAPDISDEDGAFIDKYLAAVKGTPTDLEQEAWGKLFSFTIAIDGNIDFTIKKAGFVFDYIKGKIPSKTAKVEELKNLVFALAKPVRGPESSRCSIM